jgi:hypothetical protein
MSDSDILLFIVLIFILFMGMGLLYMNRKLQNVRSKPKESWDMKPVVFNESTYFPFWIYAYDEPQYIYLYNPIIPNLQ